MYIIFQNNLRLALIQNSIISQATKPTAMLAIPLKANTGQILGVIQMINKLNQNGETCPFDKTDELLITHFASSSTVALQRANMTRAILLRMIYMAELRDPKETGPHVNRVAGYSTEIYEAWARKHNIPRKQMEATRDNFRIAAMLHDVGKVAISDVILKKKGRFNDAEYDIMKEHTWQGSRLFVSKQSGFDELAQIVAFHSPRKLGRNRLSWPCRYLHGQAH